MNDIILKAYFLNKCLVWLFVFMVITIVVISIFFNIPREDTVILSGCVIGAESYLVIFLNRFEPKYIKLFDKQFEVSYVNHKYFEKPESIYTKADVHATFSSEMLLLSDKNGIIAKIRKKALSQDDWYIIKNYFENSYPPKIHPNKP